MKKYLSILINILLVTIGVLSAGMGIKGFLTSSGFIDGGVTGFSMLLSRITPIPLWLLLPLVNLPFVVIAFFQIGRTFALRSAIAIAGLAAAIQFIPYPDVTPDLLLTAAFGGFFLGAGIALAIRGGAVLDGTEVAALLISKRWDFIRVGDIILGFNILLFVTALGTIGIEPSLYSIITYFAAARTLNYILYGIDEYTSVTIVSPKHQLIKNAIHDSLGRGSTVFRGYGGASGDDKEILYCVVTRLEIARVNSIVKELDPAAFVVLAPLSSVKGGTVKRAAFEH